MKKLRSINLTEADKVRFREKVDKRGPDDCWEWTGYRDKKGYGRFYDCNGVLYQANRVAYAITDGDTDFCVLHHCDNPPCCNPNHLYAGTDADNARDRDKRGRAADTRGEDNGRAKLTEDDVREIRRLRAGGWLQCEIAEEFGIIRQQVSRICNCKQWKHI